MPSRAVLPVQQCRVLRHAVIPHDHGPLLPPDPHLEIGPEADVVVQEFQDGVALFLLQPDDIAGDWGRELVLGRVE